MIPLLPILLFTQIAVAAEPDPAEAPVGDPAAGAAKSAACAGCHGPTGLGTPPLFPPLSGQHPTYLAKQLTDMLQGQRVEPMMAGIVAGLDAQAIADIAAHFAAQPGPARDWGAPNAKGEELYLFGRQEGQVPPCAGCHGTSGAGYWDVFPGGIPAISGQPVEYTMKQLRAFKTGQRNNDPGGVMQAITARMTEEEIVAVSKYVYAIGT